MAYPPTPAKRVGKGDSFFREAIRREPMVSPETSPATIKTLSSPSLEAMSKTAWPENEKYLFSSRKKPTLITLLKHLAVLNIFKIP